MEKREFVIAKCAEGLGLFDQECKDKEGKGYPAIDKQVLYEGKQTCKAIDMCGIQAHAGYYMIGSDGKEFEFDIDKYPLLYLTMKAEKDTDTCLHLVVHEKKPRDFMRRFVAIGTTESEKKHYGVRPAEDCFTIKDDNEWHEYTYDLRKLRGKYPDAKTVRMVQFYSGKLCNGIPHAFHFSSLVFKSMQVDYKITVKTGNRKHAGTDANVYIKLSGTVGEDVERLLDNPGRDDFERGKTDNFIFKTYDLGDLTELMIRHDDTGNKPGWYLEEIRVRNENTAKEWFFPCHRWLAIDEDDGRINRTLIPKPEVNYKITVKTGNRENAGTNANVYIKLSGTVGDDLERLLDNPGRDDFERGKTDNFIFETYDLGDLTKLIIRHDNTGNKPGWYLEEIRVRNENTAKEWVFPCHRWLAEDEDDGRVRRVLNAT